MRSGLLLTLAVLAIACGSDTPSPTPERDAGDISDAGSSDDAEFVRTFVVRPALDGLNVENRFIEPRLIEGETSSQPALWASIVVERLQLRRWVSHDLPVPMQPAFVLAADNGYVALKGNLGRGDSVVDVWIGVRSEASIPPLAPQIVGFSFGGLTPAAAKLHPTDEPLIKAGVRWQRYAGLIESGNGPAHLFVESTESEDVWVHAPRLLDAVETDRARFPSLNPVLPTERQLLR